MWPGGSHSPERIVAYAFDNGIASLSLRPLAKDLGGSPGLLLDHFRSNEKLTVEILVHVVERQRALALAVALWTESLAGVSASVRAGWSWRASRSASPDW